MSFPGVPPGYPPVPSRRPGWHGGRLLGAALALLAAAAAVTGSFFALFEGELLFQGEPQLSLTVTGWDLTAEAAQPGIPTNTFGSPVRNGYLLAAAGLLLVIAAVLSLAAARRDSSPARKFAAALATATGAAFLLATAAGIVLQGVSLHESFRPPGAAEGDGDFSTSDRLGLGFWLVAGATLAAIVAAVLAAARGRRAPQDLTTPRYGIPAPSGYQPGPQFPAPTRHWPGGEPYPSAPSAGQAMPLPHAGYPPGPSTPGQGVGSQGEPGANAAGQGLSGQSGWRPNPASQHHPAEAQPGERQGSSSEGDPRGEERPSS
ncbi:hypothetical protein [Amycolatopsis tucumanensis]|uniref:hypothetical protein n=1 Tax=Amycolatopsis tucumanensis TaxID=401106 RepID=UPI001F267FAD|nr:hypothetical protein [Amycolatopsis tucumanensis]MCF6425586.1 hypothetical protein [Amycolatopsis tucumanensis]